MGGSIGHLNDMAKISDRLIRWVLSRKNVHLYLMCADQVWELFAALPENRKRRFATGSLADYYNFVSRLDIGLAPLEDTPFNRSRSDVKFLEYAVNGVVPVVQATGPYLHSVEQGKTGFFFNSTRRTHLHARPPGLRFCLKNQGFSIRKGICTAGTKLHDPRTGPGGLLPQPDLAGQWRLRLSTLRRWSRGNSTRLCDCAGAKKKDRHLLLGSTRYELLLQSGILSSNPSEARSMFLEALQMEPSLYLPYLFGASVSGDPVQALQSAIERNPFSIVSRIHLGKAYQSKGMRVEAVESFKSAAGIVSPSMSFPIWSAPIACAKWDWKKMGSIFLRRQSI